MLYLSNQHRIQATVTGVALPAGFVWDSCEGGEVTAGNSTYYAGNMAPGVPTGGLRAPSDVTLTVRWSDDVYPHYVALNRAAGFTAMSVSITPLTNVPGVPLPNVKPITFSGILLSAKRPPAEAADAKIGYLTCTMGTGDNLTQN